MEAGAGVAIVMMMLFVLIAFGIGIAAFVFWIWMVIECATKEPNEGNDKVVWLLVVILLNWLGALVYFFVRRPTRMRLYGQ